MIRALYTATSGMLVEARKLDLTSENLYRAQLPGFKAFRLLRSAQPSTASGLATDVQTAFQSQFVDTSEGPLRPTGKDDMVDVMWWGHRGKWDQIGDIGPVVMSLDKALGYIAQDPEGIFWH